MAIILSSCNSALLISDDLLKHRCRCGEHVGQIRTLCVRSLNWLTWYLLVVLQGRGYRPVQLRAAEAAALAVCCCAVPPRRADLGWCDAWALSATLSFVSLRWHACSLYSWRGEVPLRPPTCHCSMSVSMLCCPFPGTPLQVTAPTPHTTGRWLTVSPYMAEMLAVVTLRETSLGCVRLYPDCNMAKTRHFEYHGEHWLPR
jgi:hypothetical protein